MRRVICVCPPEVVRRNREMAAGLGLPWLAAEAERNEPLAVVGGGSSAREHLDEILAWPGQVMALNGAYNWLQDQGRMADYVMVLDPEDAMAELFRRPAPGTRWFVASICNPAVFDALAGQDVTLYNPPQGDEKMAPDDIPGGSTVMTRAPILAAVIGYRRVALYGADSCYHRCATSHVYGGDIPADVVHVEAGGRSWLTSPAMLVQAEYLAELIPAMAIAIKVELVGEHLAQALLAQDNEGTTSHAA
jgi:hypothetical protein